MIAPVRLRLLGLMAALSVLAACSNGTGSVEERPQAQQPPASVPVVTDLTVGGRVSGMTGTGLVLQLNGAADLTISANGVFNFPTQMSTGTSYTVTVRTQPRSPAQTCFVTNGTGTLASADVENVTVTCGTGAFPVGGSVSGLRGSGLVLQNNGGDDLTIAADGKFSFPTLISTGQSYEVKVRTQPANQTCTIGNATGTMGAGEITNVAVTCAATTVLISGAVTGLAGAGLVLQNNGGDDLAMAADGPFTFPGPLAVGANYNVTVKSSPANPPQSCTVSNGSGVAQAPGVSNIVVSCVTEVNYTIGGTVSGLVGSDLTLQLNKANDLKVAVNGAFQFSKTLPAGAAYEVMVSKQPNNQECKVVNPSGTVTGNVTNVEVTCLVRSYSVGGSVSGLAGSGLVLRKNDGATLPIQSNGNFKFPPQTNGTAYEVTVSVQPVNPSQVCTVGNGTGKVDGADVTNVRIRCATSAFAVRGSVTGLLGSGLELQNNGGDTISIDADGAFVFPRRVASGGTYNVTVRTAPSSPTQSCSVTNGTGTITNADVTVSVSCTTSAFTVGGTVSGLAGSGLTLRNNVTDQVVISANGAFTFPTALPSGSPYSVTIAAQPINPNQTCTVSGGSGVVGGGNISSVAVTCTTSQFTLSGQVLQLAGSGLVLQNNGADNLPIASNGSFTFPGSLTTGTPYNVTVASQPSNPAQNCTVSNGTGVIGSANVTNVTVTCTTLDFAIGGQVNNLTSFGLALQNNGGEIIPVLGSGPFSFSTRVASGAPYNVTVFSQPFGQSCFVTNGSGVVGSSDVLNVDVTCVP